MNKRLNYDLVIDDIEKILMKHELTQHLVKRLCHDEFFKFLFNKSYINQRKNSLARYLKENFEFKIQEPKIICIQKGRSDFLSCFVDF